MPGLSVHLFGKLSVRRGDKEVSGVAAPKALELFCYLLLHRDRPHPREALAAQFWGDIPTSQSKKYLRHALWQLQVAIGSRAESHARRPLLIETDWVQLNGSADLWLDAAVLERAFDTTKGVPGEALSPGAADSLRQAIDLYTADLLDGWYQEWCLAERERFKDRYLLLLDKLVAYSEAHEQFETGLTYGALALRYERAREGTHQRLMRLHFLAGDRAAALRQYDRCVISLEEELGVKPSEYTTALEAQIRLGRLNGFAVRPPNPQANANVATRLSEAMTNLRELRLVLTDVQQRVDQQIRLLEQTMDASDSCGPKKVSRHAKKDDVPDASADDQ